MKVALITGSSRGIGAACALELSRKNYAVCINCIERTDKAAELADMINSSGGRAIWFKADVADADAVKEMFAYMRRELGDADLLVNNAGIAKQQQFQDIERATWDRILNVNLGGCFNTIQQALPYMLHNHSGCIINVSSVWGLYGASCESAYSASKHAIIGLTKSLAAELAPSGIRVNCVAPGVINTDMLQVLGQETLDMLADEIPLGRLGRPEEIAHAVAYLSEAGYVTGQVIAADGGFPAI